jgi:hypothetical protein
VALIEGTLQVACVMKASDRDDEVETAVAERRSQYIALLSPAGKTAKSEPVVDHLDRP